MISAYSTRPGVEPKQGIPDGYSDYGTVAVLGKSAYKIIVYIDVKGRLAVYDTVAKGWTAYSLETLNVALSTGVGLLSNTGIPWKDVNVTTSNRNVVFFTNWTGESAFPENFGSGIILPCYDASNRRVLYIGGSGKMYSGTFKHTDKNNITWAS